MNDNAATLARRLRERRIELGISQEGMRDVGGPSPDTVVKFEAGRIANRPQARTLEGFDRALSWELGSSQRILDGGEAVETARKEDRHHATKLMHKAAEAHRTAAEAHREAFGDNGSSGWCPVPRRSVQDLVLSAHKLLTLTRMDPAPHESLVEIATLIHAQATGMLALVIATERGDNELLRLVTALDDVEVERVQ